MADMGLLGGLARGLERGVETFIAQRDKNEERKMLAEQLAEKKRMGNLELEAGAMGKGLLATRALSGEIEGFERDPNYVKPESELVTALRMSQLQSGQLGMLNTKDQMEDRRRRAAMDAEDRARKENEIEGPKALAATYGRRMEEADRLIQAKGDARTTMEGTLKAKLPGFLQDEKTKSQDQAERNFLNAVLRRESGAAISPTEFGSGEMQYFPRAGDTPEILRQKAQNRAQAIAGLRAESGRAWDKIGIAPAPPAAGLIQPAAPKKGYKDMSLEELEKLAAEKGIK